MTSLDVEKGTKSCCQSECKFNVSLYTASKRRKLLFDLARHNILR